MGQDNKSDWKGKIDRSGGPTVDETGPEKDDNGNENAAAGAALS